jgi:CMP-N-acetylneuraminic acid synthetase
LIGYTIRAAQSAVGLTDYVVSTEDKEIKNIALSYGAAVVDRPESLAGDDVTSGAVLRHALDVMEDGGARYDLIVCLHPTSPIRDPAHINDAIELLSVSDADTLASVYQLPRKPHANITDGRYYLDPEDGNYSILNASIYAMKRDWFVKTNRHTGGNAIFYQMDFRHSVDIDTEIDFKIAEAMMNG